MSGTSTIPGIPTTLVLPPSDHYVEAGGATAGSTKTLLQNFPQSVANIAALQALDISSAGIVTVITRGGTTEGDGHGGSYTYFVGSTASPDGQTIIAPTTGSGRWLVRGLGFSQVQSDWTQATTTDPSFIKNKPSGTVGQVTVTNRAALRALAAQTAGIIVTELGYSNIGDGGGGQWLVTRSNTTSIDNDGTIVVTGGAYGTTSTDQCFERLQIASSSPHNSVRLNVRWFGAGCIGGGPADDCTVSVMHAFLALGVNFGISPGGSLYFPSGLYGFTQMLAIDAGHYQFDFLGDGASTEFSYAFGNSQNLTTNFCMIHFSNMGVGSQIGNFSVSNRPAIDPQKYPQSILKFTSCDGAQISKISMTNTMTLGQSTSLVYSPTLPVSQGPGGAIWVDGGDLTSMSYIDIIGCHGTALYADANPSLLLSNCNMLQNSQPVPGVFADGVMGTRPTLWIAHADSCLFNQVFTENGGAYRAFQAASITIPTSGYFTVTLPTGHGFELGDYCVINGASQNVLNHKWRINFVTTNTINISANTTGWSAEASVYCTSLFVSMLFGGGNDSTHGGGFTESEVLGLYTNTGGTIIEGTVGVYLCGRPAGGQDYTMGGVQITGIYSDFGEASVFVHGNPYTTTVSGVQLTAVKPNGGPRSNFGTIRCEYGNDIVLSGGIFDAALTAFAGSKITPNISSSFVWPYAPFTAVVLSDGGADNPFSNGVFLSDVTISGGLLQGVADSAGLVNANTPTGARTLTSAGLALEGHKMANISCKGSAFDLTSVNSAPIELNASATRAQLRTDAFTGLVATVFSSTNQSFSTGAGGYLPFDTAVDNDLSMWTISNATVLAITQAAARVRLTVNITWAAPLGVGNSGIIQITKNGAIIASVSEDNALYQSLTTGPLSVVQGDQFQVFLTQNSGTALNVLGLFQHNNFAIEIIS